MSALPGHDDGGKRKVGRSRREWLIHTGEKKVPLEGRPEPCGSQGQSLECNAGWNGSSLWCLVVSGEQPEGRKDDCSLVCSLVCRAEEL